MPFVRLLASECYTYIVAVILSLSKIMPTYSRYMLKGLVYIAIMAPCHEVRYRVLQPQ